MSVDDDDDDDDDDTRCLAVIGGSIEHFYSPAGFQCALIFTYSVLKRQA